MPSGEVARRLSQRGGGYDRNLFTARAVWNRVDSIHHNPVEAGLSERPGAWAWSSARQYLGEDPGPTGGPVTLDGSKMPGRPG
ncbi:MAG: hypothetical protein J0L61_08755 [Planctomycetes bacterium]|nr:hypothetical protein [Planctomycetota bacterium]